jgi:hypothetical protein
LLIKLFSKNNSFISEVELCQTSPNYLYIWLVLDLPLICLLWLGWTVGVYVCAGQHAWLVINSSPTNSMAAELWTTGHAALTKRNSHGLMQRFLLFQNDGKHAFR